MKHLPRAAGGALTMVLAQLSLAADKPTIGDFLYNLGPGPMAANQIIKVEADAVTNVQTAKDLVVALNAFGGETPARGFGIAFTPGRSGFEPVAVSLARYANAGDHLARLWGNTTFSYAQNRLAKAGTDYDRNAWAVSTSIYLHASDDPIVVARNAIVAGADCDAALDRMRKSQSQLLAVGGKLKSALGLGPDDELPRPVLDWLTAKANPSAVTKAPPLPAQLADLLPKLLQEQLGSGKSIDDPAKFAAELHACASKAQNEAKKKWNASQATLVLGQGWIRPATGPGSRVSLGQYATLALAYAPRDDDRSLFNLTLRHLRREVDLDTLAQTPVFKSTSILAARYTYGQPGKDTYALAELSNVDASRGTQSSAIFKRAVGLDHKLAGGLWLEFRFGRARTEDGSKLDNKALLSLKFTPDSTLEKQAKPSN